MRILLMMLVVAGLFPCRAAGEGRPVVLFDEGHGQRFVIAKEGPLDLSGLAAVFREAGCEVKSASQPFTRELLSGGAALVISGAFAPLAEAEENLVADYVARGGRLAVMLHIGTPVSGLLNRLEVVESNGVIHEAGGKTPDKDKDFTVTKFKAHPLTKGLREVALYGAWAVTGLVPAMEVLAETGPQAWVDLDRNNTLNQPPDAVQAFGVMVAGARGKGRVVVFGDDAMFQNQFLKDGNRKLAANLARWLTGK